MGDQFSVAKESVMASYSQTASVNSGDHPGPDALERLPLAAFGKHPHHNVFALPILNQFLIYAPLHSLAALMDRAAALRLRDSLLTGEDTGGGQLSEIVRTFNARAEPAPSPKLGEFAPAFLGLLPTRSCNLACQYCGFLTLDDSQKMMDLKLARDAVSWYMDLVTQAGAQQAEIHFFGGEPFCAEEVLDLAVHLARTRARETGYTVRFEVATNGTFSQQRCQWAAGQSGYHRTVTGWAGRDSRHASSSKEWRRQLRGCRSTTPGPCPKGRPTSISGLASPTRR